MLPAVTWDASQRIDEPFPHALLMVDIERNLACGAKAAFKDTRDWYRKSPKGKASTNKRQLVSADAWKLVQWMNSQEFADGVSRLMGIPDIIPDASLFGAGCIQNPPGSALETHVDFNMRGGQRRMVNALLYLNSDWSDDNGGHLVLFNGDTCFLRVRPTMGRLVIFATSERSLHGVTTVRGARNRNAISMYYYSTSATPEAAHTTLYKHTVAKMDELSESVPIR